MLGVLLLAAVTVLLAGGVYVAVGGLQPDGSDVASVTTSEIQTHADLEPDAGHPYESVVEIPHVTGEAVAVENLEVEVVTPERRARLVDLPVPDCPTTQALDGRHTEGEEMFVAGCQWGGVAVESTDDDWSRGSPLTLRLMDSRVPALADPDAGDDTVEVRVVEVASDRVVAEMEIELD